MPRGHSLRLIERGGPLRDGDSSTHSGGSLDLDQALEAIAGGRERDPLAPVTIIAPSHAAALQMRRRLAEVTPFAAVRFEPLARIAELLGAGALAASGRDPLARPIADYAADRVSREATGTLAALQGTAGFAVVLRRLFRRLRRAGVRGPQDVRAAPSHPHLREVLRLYGRFRAETSRFYDEEDLLDAAAEAVRARSAGALADLGAIYVAPPGPQTASAVALVDALHDVLPCEILDDPAEGTLPSTELLLAPDPASEAREAVREAIAALERGAPMHQVAVLYGADPAYRALLVEAFEVAHVPAVALPGMPLIETPAGRATLALCELPARDYSRTALIDALALAPLRRLVPGTDGSEIRPRVTAWDRLSRAAGITRGLERWERGLETMEREHRAELDRSDNQVPEGRRRMMEIELEQLPELRSALGGLAERLSPLADPQPARDFVAALRAVVEAYIDRDAPGLPQVLEEIDQLGTVGSIGGTFTLEQFAASLGANLRIAFTRERKLGEGVLVAAHTAAAGMSFEHVIICGAREGIFPAGPGEDAIVPDGAWRELREEFPLIEDATARSQHRLAAAHRAMAAAGAGRLTLSAPLYEPNGAREFFPSPLMVAAAAAHDASIRTGLALRGHAPESWLRRGSSPLALRVHGDPVDEGEIHLREAIEIRRSRIAVPGDHRRAVAVGMIGARRNPTFSEWDGLVGPLGDGTARLSGNTISPTSLEAYAKCGYRYFCSQVLRLRSTKEPEEREMMEAHVRGSLAHDVLERFFREMQASGRPSARERWTEMDRTRLLAILDEELETARNRGLLGLEIFTGHERTTLRADLSEFLEQDNDYRARTGAIPAQFEQPIPQTEVAGVRLRGIVDRIDRSEDGRHAWVMDYKTGSTYDFKEIKPEDPLAGGTKLQLPAYLLAAGDVDEAEAFYWFISQKGGFERITYSPDVRNTRRFESTVEAISAGIERGVFPAVPGEFNEFFNRHDNCGFCDFDRICARRREEAFIDKEGDPNMIGWMSVQQAATST